MKKTILVFFALVSLQSLSLVKASGIASTADEKHYVSHLVLSCSHEINIINLENKKKSFHSLFFPPQTLKFAKEQLLSINEIQALANMHIPAFLAGMYTQIVKTRKEIGLTDLYNLNLKEQGIRLVHDGRGSHTARVFLHLEFKPYTHVEPFDGGF